MENVGNHSHLTAASNGTAASSVLTETDEFHRIHATQYEIREEATTSGEGQPPGVPYQATSIMLNVGNHNYFANIPYGTAASSVPTEADRTTQYEIRGEASTSGEGQPPSVSNQATSIMLNVGNHNRFTNAPNGTAASSVPTGTEHATQYGIRGEVITSGDGQPTDRNTLAELRCNICDGTSFLEGQVKSLRCSHVFHQPCIDKWMNNHINCPVCRAYHQTKRIHRHRRHRSNRTH